MSVCEPVLPDFAEATVCRVDFALAAKVRDDAGIWKPLATLRGPAPRKVAAVVERRRIAEPFPAPSFLLRRKEEGHRA